jgi:type I restriction enzyme S subunit
MKEPWNVPTLGDFLSLQRGQDLTESERKAENVPVMGSAEQNEFQNEARAKGPGIVVGRSGASFGQLHFSADDYCRPNSVLFVDSLSGKKSSPPIGAE